MKRLLISLLISLIVATPLSAHNFWQYAKCTTTSIATDTTPVNVTGMAWDVGPVGNQGVSYTFRCYLLSHTTTNATSGVQYSFTGPTPTSVLLMVTTPGNNFASTHADYTQHFYDPSATGFTSFVGDSSDSLTTYHFDTIVGIVTLSVAGTIQLQVRSENTDDAFVGSGSWCEIEDPRPVNTYSPQG